MLRNSVGYFHLYETVQNRGFLDILSWGEFTPFFRLFLYINLSIKPTILG